MVADIVASPPTVMDVGVSLEFEKGEARITPLFRHPPHFPMTVNKSMNIETTEKLIALLSDAVEVAKKRGSR